MAISQSLRNRAVVVEKYVTLAATAGTTEGVAVPAGTLVLAAGVEVLQKVPNVSVYTADVTDGTTVFANDVDLDDAAANTIRVGTTAGFIATADTIDVVTTITGSPGTIRARVFAVIVDLNDSVREGTEVDRDVLA
jgi:tetrahydrodipicolinate N-succinyltransferase